MLLYRRESLTQIREIRKLVESELILTQHALRTVDTELAILDNAVMTDCAMVLKELIGKVAEAEQRVSTPFLTTTKVTRICQGCPPEEEIVQINRELDVLRGKLQKQPQGDFHNVKLNFTRILHVQLIWF